MPDLYRFFDHWNKYMCSILDNYDSVNEYVSM